jgi:hypothetical protein
MLVLLYGGVFLDWWRVIFGSGKVRGGERLVVGGILVPK